MTQRTPQSGSHAVAAPALHGDPNGDGAVPAARGAQNPPLAIFLSNPLLSYGLATSFFSRALSCPSSLMRLASFAFMPPYALRQRCQVWPMCCQTWAIVAPVASGPSASRGFAMIWSGWTVPARAFSMIL
jgi:hypothetical protein